MIMYIHLISTYNNPATQLYVCMYVRICVVMCNINFISHITTSHIWDMKIYHDIYKITKYTTCSKC